MDKKITGWNETVFNICIVLYIVYVVIYHKAYYNPSYEVNATFASIEKVLKVFFTMAPAVNFICQIVALFRKKWKAILFLVVGLIAFIVAIGLSWAQGV